MSGAQLEVGVIESVEHTFEHNTSTYQLSRPYPRQPLDLCQKQPLESGTANSKEAMLLLEQVPLQPSEKRTIG